MTPSFFTPLRGQAFLGRGFQEDEAKPGADKFVVLTYGLWQSHFGGDPAIVGHDIRLNGDPYRVTGVLPADFELTVRFAMANAEGKFRNHLWDLFESPLRLTLLPAAGKTEPLRLLQAGRAAA